MTQGEVALECSLLSFMAVGLSWMRLVFRAPKQKARVTLLPGRRCTGEYCSNCNTTIVYNAPPVGKQKKKKLEY